MSKERAKQARGVIERKLDSGSIKQRSTTYGKTLDYIEGHTVIALLNEAFDYAWSFEIVSSEVVQGHDYKSPKGGPTKLGNKYVKVLGRLRIPGISADDIVKEQYGTKQMMGATDVQEAAFKAATTDALKKCATLVGIGAQLYSDTAAEEDVETSVSSGRSADDVEGLRGEEPEEPEEPAKKSDLNKEHVEEIKELKAKLGIVKNEDLNTFVSEATKGKLKSYKDISNSNAKSVIDTMRASITTGVSS